MSFDLVASHYRWLETAAFGSALQKARAYWINQIPRPERALLVGEGDGRFLCTLLRTHPKISVDCVDASERMLALARARVQRLYPNSYPLVRFLRRDVLNWSPSGSYDLVVTNFFLDCFDEGQLEPVVAKLANAATNNAIWLIADFTIPRGIFAGAHATLWLRAMYAFFGMTAGLSTKRLVDPGCCLEAANFSRILTKLFRLKMLRSDFYARHQRLYH